MSQSPKTSPIVQIARSRIGLVAKSSVDAVLHLQERRRIRHVVNVLHVRGELHRYRLLAEAGGSNRELRNIGPHRLAYEVATEQQASGHVPTSVSRAAIGRLRGEFRSSCGSGCTGSVVGESDIAQQRSAKFWELRAAISLARLWHEQGKRDAARDLLAPIYGWFTEGFDTPVLTEAKALLDTLTS